MKFAIIFHYRLSKFMFVSATDWQNLHFFARSLTEIWIFLSDCLSKFSFFSSNVWLNPKFCFPQSLDEIRKFFSTIVCRSQPRFFCVIVWLNKWLSFAIVWLYSRFFFLLDEIRDFFPQSFVKRWIFFPRPISKNRYLFPRPIYELFL